MKMESRHQCLIYEGSPSRMLQAVATILRQKLSENYRCLYLNSTAMVAGMRCYLAAAGTDVAYEVGRASLVLQTEQRHLVGGTFQTDRMMYTLDDALDQALNDGYSGLWATGDMTWELGPQKDISKLLEYELQLEEFMRQHPALGGICQYHAETLPREILRQALYTHPSIFLNETLSHINPHYLRGEYHRDPLAINPQMESMIDRLCACENPN
jgi:hypothetical protein